MENKNKIEIPFGAKDSELCECEYTIPEGYEAEIKDGKVIIRKVESEDEKIRKEIIKLVKDHSVNHERCQMEAWLEKQGEQKLTPIFRIGDTIIAKDGTYIKKEPFHIDKIEDDCYWDGENTIFVCNQNKFKIFKQKPTDKVEPKFKVGDWVVSKLGRKARQISEVHCDEYNEYYIVEGNGYDIEAYDRLHHLWTIQDAKEGDVLLSPSTPAGDKECPFIFKEIDKSGIVRYHAALLQSESFKIADGITNVMGYANAGYHIPANKEQRDLLFKKMKEGGYEWDADTKELKKISNALEECEIEHIEHGKYYYCIKDYYSGGCKRVSKGEVVQALRGMSMIALGVKANEYFIPVKCIIDNKVAWSEEDEEVHRKCICAMRASACGFPEEEKFVEQVDNWLKSLKDRVQPKQEWGEEDEKMIDNIIDYMMPMPIFFTSTKGKSGKEYTKEFIKEAIDWLKSLRPQNWTKEDKERYISCLQRLGTGNPEQPETINSKWFKEHVYSKPQWKPSEEQVTCLHDAVARYNREGFSVATLTSLLEQLKKLREE